MRCRRHRDDAEVRASDHTAMYRRALDEARDETARVEGERDFYRDRAAVATKDVHLMVNVLTAVDDLHRDRDGACACGDSECSVGELLSRPSVRRLMGRYDEQRHALTELRRANPDRVSSEDELTFVDVRLAFPARQLPPARHRRTG